MNEIVPSRPAGHLDATATRRLDGAALCLEAIFLPSGLLVIGVIPFWEDLRRQPAAQAVLRGANAAIVGPLLAALCQPIWTCAVHIPADVVVTLAAYGALVFWRLPPCLVIVLAALVGCCLR